MRRVVLPFDPTWKDKHFLKASEALDGKERKKRAEEMAQLFADLQVAGDLCLDQVMAKWKPSAYQVRGCDGLVIVELRPRYPLRVIVRHLEAMYQGQMCSIVQLLTVTLTHDHDRMKGLIERSAAALRTWQPPNPAEFEDQPSGKV